MDPVEAPDADYDLWLCTGRILEHWHTGSMTRRVPELDRAAPRAVLYMNPGDAERRGIRRGDAAVVTSRHGQCRAVVETKVRNLMPRGMTLARLLRRQGPLQRRRHRRHGSDLS